MKITKHAKREATELFRDCVVDGVLNPTRVHQKVDAVAVHKGRDYLGILQYLKRLVQIDAARHSARVETDYLLPENLRNSVTTALTQAYGKGLTISFVENPALIG